MDKNNQLDLKDYQNFETFKLKDRRYPKAEGYCSYIDRKCTQFWLHIAAKTMNNDGCPEKCCILCENINCRVRCKGAGKKKRVIPQEYLNDGWHELRFGDHPYPKLKSNWYELQVLYKYVDKYGHDLYLPFIAAYKDFEFVLLNKKYETTKGEIVAWKYIEEPEDD